MEDNLLAYYIERFKKMRRSVMQGFKAPHKPVLLLAVLELVEKGVITSNHIMLTPELEACFKRLWTEYVDDGGEKQSVMVAEGLTLEIHHKFPFKYSIQNPFYYLQFEPFWRLEKSDNYVKRSTYSLKALKECFLYAEMDEALFSLMQNEEAREEMRLVLLSLIEESKC